LWDRSRLFRYPAGIFNRRALCRPTVQLAHERINGAALGLCPNVGVMLEHFLRNVSGHVPNDLVARAALREIGNEGMAVVVKPSLDISTCRRTLAPNGLMTEIVPLDGSD
jgi:hypothetical protein